MKMTSNVELFLKIVLSETNLCEELQKEHLNNKLTCVRTETYFHHVHCTTVTSLPMLMFSLLNVNKSQESGKDQDFQIRLV